MLITQVQTAAAERMEKLGQLYFSGVANDSPLKPRFWPLLTGPTGSGKNHLARVVAGRLGARYVRLSFGDWIAQGSRQVSTLYGIINTALGGGRIVLHLDELDKLPLELPQEWSRAVTNEIWSVLDGELPLERFAEDPGLKEVIDARARRELARTDFFARIFIIGSGTWQSIYDDAKQPDKIIGFSSRSGGLPPRRSMLQTLGETRGIASELLARFDGEILFLSPPSVDEAIDILYGLGIVQFTAFSDINVPGILAELLPRQGFRALESVVTQALIAGWRPTVTLPPANQS